jgi:hypothetical protein
MEARVWRNFAFSRINADMRTTAVRRTSREVVGGREIGCVGEEEGWLAADFIAKHLVVDAQFSSKRHARFDDGF